MKLPTPRGPLSAAVLDDLAGRRRLDPAVVTEQVARPPAGTDPLTDDDVHLALWVLYELHHHGFEDVPEDREWDPDLLRVRGALEAAFETALRASTEEHVVEAANADGDVPHRLFRLAESFDGPSVARFVHREADLEQLRELMVHRSIYQLKEADPHTWVVPRLEGAPKAALVELQFDEYGGGRPARVHATLFGDALEACGLDRRYGAYLDRVPGYTLALNNAMTLLGLHRRLRGAAMGHLAALEATSSLPCRKLVAGIRRLGLPEPVAAYFDEHVEADAVHEQLAAREICGALVEQEPHLLPDVFLGAAVCLLMDRLGAERMLAGWQQGRTTLLPEPDALVPAVA